MATINWTKESDDLSSITGVLVERVKNNGIYWTWKSFSGVSMSDTKKHVYFAWQFDWDELKKQEIYGFDATITVSYHRSPNSRPFCSSPNVPGFPKTFAFELTRSGQWVDHYIGSESDVGEVFVRGDVFFKCAFVMKPVKNGVTLNIFDKTFASSDKTDVILLVEGKKLHVNKQFLSFHSEYFNTLFNSEFKEKSMDEISIEDVKYDDFARLLSVIYPNPILPTVNTFETLLKLADRFMMPKVTCLVEQFLIHIKTGRISEKLALADKYAMNELLELCLKSIKTTTDMKRIAETSDFEQLSHETKNKLFYKTLTLL